MKAKRLFQHPKHTTRVEQRTTEVVMKLQGWRRKVLRRKNLMVLIKSWVLGGEEGEAEIRAQEIEFLIGVTSRSRCYLEPEQL